MSTLEAQPNSKTKLELISPFLDREALTTNMVDLLYLMGHLLIRCVLLHMRRSSEPEASDLHSVWSF
jgi:hypothetical protein